MALLFASWAGYAHFARRRAESRPSILAATNRVRRLWMLQTTYREVRVVDGVVIQNLSSSPSFFASTTILIIGGLLAMLGTSEKASDLVRDIPFAARTSNLVFDMKLLLMLAIFVYAFFRFTWSMRQYTFGALLIAAAPEAPAIRRGRPLARSLRRPRRPDRRAGGRDVQRRSARVLLFVRRDRLVLLAARVHGRDAVRRLHPLPARVPLRRARGPELLSALQRPLRSFRTQRRRAPAAGR
jgi:hypothetical protein